VRLPVVQGLPAPQVLRAAAGQVWALGPRLSRLLGDAEWLLRDAAALVRRVEATRAEADTLVHDVESTRSRAAAVVATAELLALRVVDLLESVDPVLRQATPALDRLARTTGPRTVDSAVRLVDELVTVAPDLHDLLEVSRELNEILGHVPGVRRIKRRVEEEQGQAEE
jgi:ABC-type transporter Mla subunit MlaD